jgi:hypothetical protein
MYGSTFSLPHLYLEMRGQHHALATLPAGKQRTVTLDSSLGGSQ